MGCDERFNKFHGKDGKFSSGPGSGGGGYKPGNWQKSSNEDRVRQLMANLEEDLSASVKKKMIERDGPDAVRKLAEEMAASNGVTYTNGEHTVRITSTKITEAHQKELLQGIDVLQTHAPVDGPLNISVDPSREFDPGVGGETYVGTGNIRLNERIFIGYDANDIKWSSGMPVAENMKASRYVLIHEWGHAVDNQTGNARNQPASGAHVDLSDRKVRKAMSEYGNSMPHEGYAEAFAEWAWTRGKTDNAAARAYAEHYGWRERWPSLSTTSS